MSLNCIKMKQYVHSTSENQTSQIIKDMICTKGEHNYYVQENIQSYASQPHVNNVSVP